MKKVKKLHKKGGKKMNRSVGISGWQAMLQPAQDVSKTMCPKGTMVQIEGIGQSKIFFDCFTLIGAIAIVFSGLTRTQTVERNLITIVEFDPIKKILVGRFDTPYYKQKNLA